MPRGRPKGGQKYGGRAKGTPNKYATDVKEAVLQALDAGAGAVSFFTDLKEQDPKTFAGVVSKLLPREITGPGGKDLIPRTKEDEVDTARRVIFLLAKIEKAHHRELTIVSDLVKEGLMVKKRKTITLKPEPRKQ